MKLELKKIEYSPFASEETHCYQADLWVDGKKWAVVGNDGHGGPDHLTLCDRGGDVIAEMRKVNAWLCDSERGVAYAKECAEAYGEGMAYDLEAWCSEQMNMWLTVWDMRRVMKKKLLWVGEDGAVYQCGLRSGRAVTKEIRETMRQRDPAKKWLMTPEEAAVAMLAAEGGA